MGSIEGEDVSGEDEAVHGGDMYVGVWGSV